jgi:D-erythro-7,8-dihydroneopterin triphosphate epimerase
MMTAANPRIQPTGSIRIKNLRLRCRVGLNPEEQEKRQDIVVNVTAEVNLASVLRTDRLDQSLNYRTLCKQIIERVETSQFQTLESLAGSIAELMTRTPALLSGKVQVDKPHALRFADSVSVSLNVAPEFKTDA